MSVSYQGRPNLFPVFCFTTMFSAQARRRHARHLVRAPVMQPAWRTMAASLCSGPSRISLSCQPTSLNRVINCHMSCTHLAQNEQALVDCPCLLDGVPCPCVACAVEPLRASKVHKHQLPLPANSMGWGRFEYLSDLCPTPWNTEGEMSPCISYTTHPSSQVASA